MVYKIFNNLMNFISAKYFTTLRCIYAVYHRHMWTTYTRQAHSNPALKCQQYLPVELELLCVGQIQARALSTSSHHRNESATTSVITPPGTFVYRQEFPRLCFGLGTSLGVRSINVLFSLKDRLNNKSDLRSFKYYCQD